MSLLFPRASPFYSVGRPLHSDFTPFVNLFNDTFNELQKISNDTQTTFSPKFDVKESKTNYVLEGELAGVDQKDVTIEWSDENTLTIKGRTERYYESDDKPSSSAADAETQKTDAQPAENNHEESKEVTTTQQGSTDVAKQNANGHHYWVSERTVGSFARSFSFPGAVDHDAIKASLKNGILNIVVPKAEKKPTSKRINIE